MLCFDAAPHSPAQHPRQVSDVIDKELLEILACPQTHQSLSMADDATLARLNAAIAAGSQRNIAGKPVAEKLTEALLRQDRKLAYPIRDGIPVLLADEGLPLA